MSHIKNVKSTVPNLFEAAAKYNKEAKEELKALFQVAQKAEAHIEEIACMDDITDERLQPPDDPLLVALRKLVGIKNGL